MLGLDLDFTTAEWVIITIASATLAFTVAGAVIALLVLLKPGTHIHLAQVELVLADDIWVAVFHMQLSTHRGAFTITSVSAMLTVGGQKVPLTMKPESAEFINRHMLGGMAFKFTAAPLDVPSSTVATFKFHIEISDGAKKSFRQKGPLAGFLSQ